MTERNDTYEALHVTSVTATNPSITELRTRIREHWDKLSGAGQSVCRRLLEVTPEQLLYTSAAELGSETRTSNATVVRTLQAIGYSGLADLKGRVAGPFSSGMPPELRARKRLELVGSDLEKVWESVTLETVERIELMRRNFDVARYRQAVGLLTSARSVLAYGFGASYVAAEHLALRLRRLGYRARPLAADGIRFADELLGLEQGDAVVCIVPARKSVEVEALLERSKDVGAEVILISDELVDQLEDMVSVTLHAPRTPTGLSGEPTAAMVWADALAQAAATVRGDQAVESSHSLTTLRERLGY